MIEQLLNGFRKKVYALFSAADPVNNLPARDLYIQFFNPGVPLSAADLDFSLSNSDSARATAAFARLSNTLPDRWSSPDTPLWSIFDQILTQTALAQNSLSQAEQQKLQQARDLLVQHKTVTTSDGPVESIIETAQYAMYKQLMTAYERARLKYNNLKITAQYSSDPKDQSLWQLNEPVYREALSRYYGDWVSRGSKNDIESAIQFIDQVTGRGPGLRWKTMKDDFSISKRSSPSGNTYYDTQLQPSNIARQSSKSWIELSCNLAEADQLNQAIADDGVNTDADNAGLDAQSLSVELLQAFLTRPWFDASVFNSRAWKWSADSGISQPLSSGQWPPPSPSGLMPVYPVSVIFARKLHLSGVSGAAGQTSAGPFHLPEGSASGADVTADGLQLIGLICAKVPHSPDPDPGLQWLQ
ncbi:MAG: hypothetical protein Tsb002_07620 [Wenzhouxiangellaceae bacterium]